ncbi:hypothetical protein RHMOL_RhmolUnG0002300 [Rhododendron molle]|nr:hypothetical protein RHMOL_RhmolUnG0002300 [Rhododendron molle]
MADGTISVMEGLGCKAIDSNEMRRKQKGISDQLSPIQIQSLQVGNPKSTNPSEMVVGLDDDTNKSSSVQYSEVLSEVLHTGISRWVFNRPELELSAARFLVMAVDGCSPKPDSRSGVQVSIGSPRNPKSSTVHPLNQLPQQVRSKLWVWSGDFHSSTGDSSSISALEMGSSMVKAQNSLRCDGGTGVGSSMAGSLHLARRWVRSWSEVGLYSTHRNGQLWYPCTHRRNPQMKGELNRGGSCSLVLARGSPAKHPGKGYSLFREALLHRPPQPATLGAASNIRPSLVRYGIHQ